MFFDFKCNMVKFALSKKRILTSLYYSYISLTSKVENNKIAFCCFNGRSGINCNPKYILKEILKQNLPYKIVWLCYKDFIPDIKQEKIEFVDYENTHEKFKALATSKLWIENNVKLVEFDNGLIKKKNQIYINTWHGSLGIKRIFFDNNLKRSARTKKNLRTEFNSTDILFTNCDWEENIFKSATKYKNLVKIGHPRLDVFFKENNIKNEIYEKYNIPKNKKLALYIPTFRDSMDIECYSLDYEKLNSSLKEKFDGEWVIATRFHQMLLKNKNKFALVPKSDLELTYHPDVQELLVASDVIISDYSSCMFDYMLTKRPCFVFATDIEKYNTERGFYYSLEETPFPIATNNEELCQNILNFDCEKYKIKCEQFLKEKNIVDDGHASERAVEIIKNYMK